MLLILSVILINIDIYSFLHNIIAVIISLVMIIIVTFILTYLSNSIIIPLIISLIPLITRFDLNTQTPTIGFYLGYYRIFELLKNIIMLLSVLFAVFFRLMFEKKLPKEPLLHIPSALKTAINDSRRKLYNSKMIVLSNVLIALGIFFYVSYIIAILARGFLEYYFYGIIISATLFVISVFIRIAIIENTLIMISSWFSPILFLALLSDLSINLTKLRLPSRGVYLGKIKAELSFTKGALKTYEFMESDKNVWIKDKWMWIKTKGEYYYDPLSQDNPHILIVGSSGTGKSTLASILSCGLYNYLQSAILIIDFHGEYYKLIKTINPTAKVNVINSLDNKISLFDIIGKHNVKERSLEVSAIIQKIFNLGPLQRIFLQRIIEEAYAIINETGTSERKALLEAYNIVLDNAQTDQELRSIRSLEPYIRTLALEFFGTTNISISNIFKDITIIDLSPLYSEYFKNLYAELILLKIYDNLHTIYTNTKNTKYILIDEAHRIAGNNNSVLAKIVAESRKYNIGIIVLTQHPKSINEDIIGNTALQIILQLKEPSNLEYTAKLLAGYRLDDRLDVIKKAIYYLPKFHGIVKDSLIREPLLIDFTRKLGGRNG